MKNEPMKNENTPTWEFAVLVYISVLENPDAPVSRKEEVKEEILRLARMADKMTRD